MTRGRVLVATALVTAVGALTGGGAVGTPVAQAHADCAFKYYGGVSAYRGKACNRSSGHSVPHFSHWLDGCDGYGDGLLVRAWAQVIDLTVDPIPGDWDSNGPASGCATDQYVGVHLIGQKICVQLPAGCSGWLWH